MNDILHLSLKRKWFDEILNGQKKIEYREIKPYWQTRLINANGVPKKFSSIIFKNGYGKKVPTLEVEYTGLTLSDQYEIHLGKVISSANI